MVQGNPAQPIATVEIPLGPGVSLKEFAKVCDHSDNGRGSQIPLGFRKICAAELFSAAQVSRHERNQEKSVPSTDRNRVPLAGDTANQGELKDGLEKYEHLEELAERFFAAKRRHPQPN